jgi:hypothetical protein
MAEGLRTDISKQEAAKRELETAIALYFCDDDAVSIHVLASAASQILYDVCQHRGVRSFRDTSLDYIVENYHREWIKRTRQAFEYFKHARADAAEELARFHPNANDFVLFAACFDYANLYGLTDANPAIICYFGWFLGTRPEMMREGFPHRDTIRGSFKELVGMAPKEQRQWARKMLVALYDHVGKRMPVTGLSSDQPLYRPRYATAMTVPEFKAD